MKPALLLPVLFAFHLSCLAQKIDSIYFHLYTDSLKKGVHNYINVDGKLADGSWRPLTSKEIIFSSSAGVFEGNSLIIDSAFKGEKVTIKAALRSNPGTWKQVTVYIKKINTPEKLRSLDEILNEPARKERNKKSSRSSLLLIRLI